MSRPLRMLLIHPGADVSTVDVFNGVNYGLKAVGVEVIPYRLDDRIDMAHKWLHIMWRQKNKVRKVHGADLLPKPTMVDTMYQAGIGALEMAHRHQVDVVFVVTAMLLHPDVIALMKRTGLRVVVLFTETPYDLESEVRVAKMVDGCWTTERSCVPAFTAVNPSSGYLRHAWHPEKHGINLPVATEPVPSHDVVFVGTGFSERVEWFNAIDWTGIDLGLYGVWNQRRMSAQVRGCLRARPLDNAYAAALYQRAKIGLNLYRTFTGWGGKRSGRKPVDGESLSPRAYELAACGVFHLSAYRAEVPEVFGDLVPTFRTPQEAETLIRHWLPDHVGRASIAAQLPACVAEASWVERAKTIVGDLQRLVLAQAA